MTRFARAKGSKASNEKVPEEATSWQEMKRQMKERQFELKERADKERPKSEGKLINGQSTSNVDASVKWASFQDVPFKKNKIKVKNFMESDSDTESAENKQAIVANEKNGARNDMLKQNEFNDCKKNILIADFNDTADDSDDAPAEVSAKITPVQVLTKSLKRKKERIIIDSVNAGHDTIKEQGSNEKKRKKEKTKHQDHEEDEAFVGNKKSNKKKKKLSKNPINAEQNNTNEQKPVTLGEQANEEVTDNVQKKNKRRKRKSQQAEGNDATNTEGKQKNSESNKNNKNMSLKNSHNLNKHNINQQNNRGSKRKLPKIRDNEEHKRRKPLLEDTTIVLNGKRVELMYFGGFLIKKEDANRLFKLRNEMRKRGVPRSEMDLTLKLERRKAEKALAREKKRLCFHCRQSGHELSECPNLNDGPNAQTIATDICFKCGSTEHTHFECKVVRGDNYKFATCFICKEEGHISKQCPDNPRGIYPKGGACRVCQDVTHLKKDCPVYQQQQESANATLNQMGSGDVEALEGEDKPSVNPNKVKAKRIVKFKA